MKIENWKAVPGYEGLYIVSDQGKIISFQNKKAVKLLKQWVVLSGGDTPYLKVALYKNQIRKLWKVHRIVAITFLDNPRNCDQVNHKDKNGLNNYVENLEWCTGEENMKHMFAMKIKKELVPAATSFMKDYDITGIL